MKNHLKRIAAPKTWVLNRREKTFIVRPNTGGHPLELGLALGVILRDHVKVASTMSEAKKLLDKKEVLVDGKRRTDHRFLVGLFDVVSLPEIQKHYRVILDTKGRIDLKEIPAAESKRKICKITGKTAIAGGKTQFNLHDGRNIITTHKARVGDSFIVSLPTQEVQEVLPLKEGSFVFLAHGKHSGDVGVLKQLHGKEARYLADGKEVETAKEYLFVVGNKEAVMTIR